MDSRPNQDLFTLNPLPSWIYDCGTLEIIEVNRAAIDHYGYSRSEFLSLTLKHLRPAAEIPKLMQVHTDIALRTGNINFGIFTHQKKSGELIRMEINGHKMDYQNRQCVLAVCLDVTEKERQVQLLKDADEKLKSISAMAKIGYWRQDLDGTALTWTDEVFSIWERDNDSFEVNFENFVATIHPDDLEGFFKEQKAAFAEKKSLDVVHRIILPDQRIKWVHELGRFIKDQDGKAISFEGTVQDITDRKEEEQRLKLLESVITNTNDAVLITEAEPFDEPGPRIIYVNEAFTKMTGYTAEEVIGKTPRILQGPNSDQVELKRLSKAIRNWESYEITTQNYKKNGEEFWVNFKVTPVANKTGNYTHWIAIERDVTERKRIEEKLIKSKEIAEENEYKMREAQKLAHLGSWYYDVVNHVSQWSEETYNIWGLNPDFTPVNLIDHKKLVHPKDWKRFNAVINNAIEKGIPYKMELELVRSDGTYKTVNTIGAPIFDENNKVIAFKGTTQDISDRIIIENELRKAKEKAERSQYAMSQASNLAKIGYWDHDFATNAITWSDYIYRLFNLTPEDTVLSYLEAKNYFDRPSQEKMTVGRKELIEKGSSYDLELRMVNSKNEEIFLRKVIHPVFNDKKEIIGERGVIQNITDGKYLQELNREVAKMVKIGSWSIDLEEQKVFWTEQIHQIHETDWKSYVPNLNVIINFYRADFREMVQSCIEKAIATGEGYDYEAVIITAKNNEVWIRSIGSSEFINGKCVRLYGGFQDINNRKREEEAKVRFQETLENSLNEIYIFDSETLKFSYVNKGAMLNLGYTKQELETLTPLDLKPEYSATAFKQLIGALLRQEKEKIIFYSHHKRKDGSLYPVEVHLKLLTEGTTKRFVANVLDISERKKAEEENRFKANLLGMIGQAVIATNLDGIVNFWNKAAEHIYGWKQEEALGENILHLTPNEASAAQAAQLMEMLKKEQSWSGKFDVRRKDGTYFPAHVTNSPIYDENNILTGIIGISSDITQEVKNKELLRQYTLQLERSNEELEQFAFITSHDLQEPLRMITSFMDQLKRKYGDQLDEKAHQYIHFATDGAKQMKQIILDLLEYSRVGKSTDSMEQIDLNEILSDFNNLRRKVISEKSVTISTSYLPTIFSYKIAITQVLHSLLDNAIKYSKKGIAPHIEIKTFEKKDEWIIAVQDNGIGIHSVFHDKIFILFQRLHNRHEYDGTGIGLSIAKKQVEFWGGKIWLESTPGEGSTFYFTLPKS